MNHHTVTASKLKYRSNKEGIGGNRRRKVPVPAISAGWTATQLCVSIRIFGHPHEKVLFCNQQSGIDMQGEEIRTVQQIIGTSVGDS